MKPYRNIIIITLSIASIAFCTHSFAEGNHSGNGGVLVERNGQLLSFFSAKATLKIPLQEMTEEMLPELLDFEKKLARIELPDEEKYELLTNTKINDNRHYYKVDLNQVPGPDLEQIKKEYQRAVQTHPGDKVVLTAITKGKDTFLFEPYFKIKDENTRLAIIAHESYWVTSPEASYPQVIDSEIRFQECLVKLDQAPSEATVFCNQWIESISKIKNDRLLPIRAAVTADKNAGRLDKILNENGKIPLSFIVPSDVFNLNAIDYETTNIKPLIYGHLMAQQKKYPDLQFLPLLIRSIPNLRISGLNRVCGVRFTTKGSDDDLKFDAYRTLEEGGARNLSWEPWKAPRSYLVLRSFDNSLSTWRSTSTGSAWLLSATGDWEGDTVTLEL